MAAPALLGLLTQKMRPADEPVKTAATLALARLSNAPTAVEAILRIAEDPRMVESSRRAAATALGLLRRTRADLQMSGTRLDALRKRLFAICDSEHTPRTVRCLAAMSIGMLSDQPYEDTFPSGLVVTWNLWKRLKDVDQDTELTVALLTALALQPAEGVPDGVHKDLQHVIFGRRIAGRRWNEWERSHAFTALMRLKGRSRNTLLLRVLSRKRGVSTSVRRAAFIALGTASLEMSQSERLDAVKAWDAGRRHARDPLTKGLASISLGRVLADDLEAGSTRLLTRSASPDTLLKAARRDPSTTRGFAVLAVALAARQAIGGTKEEVRFRRASEAMILNGLREARGDAAARGAHAVAAGLLSMRDALPFLDAIVGDRNEDPELRGFAAVACGQIGKPGVSTLRALHAAIADHRSGTLRQEAALGLAYLTGNKEAPALRQQMARARRHASQHIGHLALALGQMGDLDAVKMLTEIASDKKAERFARGAAAVALGLICDPEETPSLARLWTGVNYPARTVALHDALDFL